MSRTRFLVAWAVWVALPAAAVAQRPDVAPVPVGTVADRLGVKTMMNSPRELDVGHSITATLAEPKKLVAYGIKGMHEGARVTITCVGPNRVRVEAEEMEPVEQRTIVTLRLADDGSLTPVEAPPSQSQPPKPPPA